MPVQLKTVTGDGMKVVQRNVIDANKSLQKAGYHQAELYIDATQTSISRSEIDSFVKVGTPISNMLNEGAIKSISINTKDGWIIFNRTNFKK